MNVYVDGSRFLSVPCEAQERIVFDRKDGKYHLLRESAARLWEQIEEGGVFELEVLPSTEGADDPVDLLKQAGLLEIVDGRAAVTPTTPQISRRMWIGHTGKLAAVTAVLPLVTSG